MKTRIVVAVALFVASAVLEGIATKLMPIEQIGKIVVKKAIHKA